MGIPIRSCTGLTSTSMSCHLRTNQITISSCTIKTCLHSTTTKWRRKKLSLTNPWDWPSKTEETSLPFPRAKRSRCKILLCKWCRCMKSTDSAISLIKAFRTATTAASFSQMIAEWWWWFQTRDTSKIRDAHQETNRGAEAKCSRHSTLRFSKRTRAVQARFSDNSNQSRHRSLHTETRQSLRQLLLRTDANCCASRH